MAPNISPLTPSGRPPDIGLHAILRSSLEPRIRTRRPKPAPTRCNHRFCPSTSQAQIHAPQTNAAGRRPRRGYRSQSDVWGARYGQNSRHSK
jgi:hypothetical protein